ALRPADPELLAEYAQALYPPGSPEPWPAEFEAVMRRLLALDPRRAEALFFVAEFEARAGNRQEAARLLDRLLERLPPDAAGHSEILRRRKALDGS
ncbi:MAG: hypothetical protein LDL44_14590, partial [Caenispirillum sp.]|nr:hypothetical protein [Caenispirillum sp.]